MSGEGISVYARTVAFHETDAMGIVHHANYARFFEEARVLWLEEHDVPYQQYMELGLHFAVTRLEVSFRRAARFGERIETMARIEWVRGASLRVGYELRIGDELVATGATEHAMVDGTGRACRIPAERRRNLQTKVAERTKAAEVKSPAD